MTMLRVVSQWNSGAKWAGDKAARDKTVLRHNGASTQHHKIYNLLCGVKELQLKIIFNNE